MGDSKAAGRFMMLGTILNACLNPIFIFGWLGFPALGIRGSALATVVAQAVSTTWLFYLLYVKHRLIVLSGWGYHDCLASWRRILGFAVPGTLSMVLMPISASVITRLLAGYGSEAVAAAGVASRIEMFAFVIPMALGISLTPFVSQNFGANRLDRIREAMTLSTRFAFLYGAGIALVFFSSAPWLAAAFSDDARVTVVLTAYIRIISFGYGMMEIHRYCGFFFTGLHRPVSATALNVIRVLVLLIPLSLLGARVFGIRGVFFGRLTTDLAVGSVGLVWVRRCLRRACA
jgi:Na+-driven multidrug efflux pump